MGTLPIRRNIKPICVLSCVIAALMAVASLAGLLFRGSVYPSSDLQSNFVPNDVVSLFLGIPILLGSVLLVSRGRLIGLLLLPGALFFSFYNYVVYALAMPINSFFVIYPTLVALSGYTTLSLFASIDRKSVKERLAGAANERISAAVLIGLGAVFLMQAAGALISLASSPISRPELALHISDVIITPFWVVAGVFLWRRSEIGYTVSLPLLFQASMLFIGLIVFLFLQPILTSVSFVPSSVVVIFVFGLICFIPFALFSREVVSRDSMPSQ